MATEKEVGIILTTAMPLYANYHPPVGADAAVLVKAWHKVVGHLDRDTLQAAMLDAVTRTEFFPTPMLVLDRAVALKALPAISSGEAWGLVMADVRRGVGYPWLSEPASGRAQPTVDEAAQKAVEAIGGWKMLAVSTDEDDITHRARFAAAYDAIVKRGREELKELPAVTAARLQPAVRAVAQRLTASRAAQAGAGAVRGARAGDGQVFGYRVAGGDGEGGSGVMP